MIAHANEYADTAGLVAAMDIFAYGSSNDYCRFFHRRAAGMAGGTAAQRNRKDYRGCGHYSADGAAADGCRLFPALLLWQ